MMASVQHGLITEICVKIVHLFGLAKFCVLCSKLMVEIPFYFLTWKTFEILANYFSVLSHTHSWIITKSNPGRRSK